MAKFTRSNFFNQNTIDGNIENDLAFTRFDEFDFKRKRIFFTITDKYVSRPDLIALDMLGKIDYWWVILKLNNIDDVYNDMTLGKVIQIPSLSDVEEFGIVTKRKKDLS